MEQQINNTINNSEFVENSNSKGNTSKHKLKCATTNYASYETWANTDMWKADGVES